ncbi:hypothetical protein HHI36_017272 [Cryptolaemus montrouzieri]|uniref:Uncharacterized protein n=1 Tax=Cryptolaemus montrouzieri TaxID=559131 RepID=A0ABD2NMH6_9CUCU
MAGNRIVEMALENPYESDSEFEDVVSSFDSDWDPMFLSSSDEDVSNNSDISDQDMKQKGSTRKISNKKRKFRKTCSEENQMTKIPKMDANSLNQPGTSRFVSEFGVTREEENSIGVPSFSSQLLLSEPIEEEFPGSHPTFSQPVLRNKRKNLVGNHQVFDYTADAGLSPNYAATLENNLSPYGCFGQ